MRRIFVAALLAIISSPALRAAEQWLRLTTPHFEMFTTAGEKKGRECILYFETVRQFFIDARSAKNTAGAPVRIVAFRNEKEFRPYAPNEVAMAFYAGGLDRDFIVMSEIGPEHYPAAVHEYVHLAFEHSGITLPLWLNEGMAELFSTLRPMGKKAALGDVIPGRILEARTARLLDLQTLISIGHDSPYYNERNRASIFYDESWALTHMLEVTVEYHSKFAVFFSAIAAGEGTEAAFRKAYGKSLADVQKDLFAYIRGNDFKALEVSIQLEKSAEDPDVQPVSPWDADLVLAEIMSSSANKAAMDRQMLNRLMAEQPKRPEPPAILAELALREGHREEAIQMFAKASELGDTNPEMYFRYAMVLWGRPQAGGDTAVIQALRKAVELKPDYPEAHMRLGFALMDHGDYRQALPEFARLRTVKPEDAFSFFYSVAYATYRVGDAAQARIALDKAKKWAKEPSQQMSVDQLSQVLDSTSQRAADTPVPPSAQSEAVETVSPSLRLPRIEGTLDVVECGGEKTRLAIVSGGNTVWFLVDNPNGVRITNAGGGSVDFTCGKQPGRPVLIEYQDRPDAETKTIGVVRGIEFR
jgi:tetratricopeptide (TPR) repeat protein